ncbi:hypothetical protein HPHPP25_0836 [Helicobacter pylori Hp P-25]|nr:hypothetical protein HPHPP25_0836 [Helicobacter pylori Hp P-25]EJC35311.1 hypothetical protein HPHPP25C_0644 [Helicobacter pylori Hp P-25c]EJC36449.1 hypothetical protein HPHPP25D_0922 [Helicobacter pylori Hp P-25d]
MGRSNSVKSLIIGIQSENQTILQHQPKKPMSLAFGRFTILKKAKNLF